MTQSGPQARNAQERLHAVERALPDCEVLFHAPSTLSQIVFAGSGSTSGLLMEIRRRRDAKAAATAASLEGTVAMTEVLDTAITNNAVYRGPSAQAWFAVGERVGYDPKARAIVAAQDAPLKTFLKREGGVSHAVTFLPGYPDGSFGWAKVRPHLPNAAEMPKEYVGMGDSDKPKDYAYSTTERTDLVEALWRDLSVQSTTLVAFDFSSLVVLE